MKVLIFTAKLGMGHFRGAQAIAEELRQGPGRMEVELVDIYDLALKDFADIFYKAYNLLVNKGNDIYNFSYQRMVTGHSHCPLEAIHQMSLGPIEDLIESFKPDVLISSFSASSMLLSAYKKRTGDRTPLVTWITDVRGHRGWVQPYTDYYVVADETTKESLESYGVGAERILIGGIPVSMKFKGQLSKRPGGKKMILIMGGGLGLLPKSMDFYRRLSLIEDCQLVVICGKNAKLYKKLKKKLPLVLSLGFVDNVEDWMARADILISKPGGISSFEAIYSETPMAVFKPRLVQEEANAEFIQDMGLGLVLDSQARGSWEEVSQLDSLIHDPQRLEAIRGNMRRTRDLVQLDLAKKLGELVC